MIDPPKKHVVKLDDMTYKILRSSPEAVALRTRSSEWHAAADADGLDHSEGCKHQKAAERAHRVFLDAALQFAEAVRRRGSEHMHLWARPGELVQFFPMTADARKWATEHAWDKKYVLMERYWCESLTVRSPLDKRRRRTFTGLEASWGHVDRESERVRYERALGLRRDPWDKSK